MSHVSTKPYLLRAIYEWCVDQSFTPYVAVAADERTVVPRQYVKDGQIVLNIGPEAAHQLSMGNDLLTFAARFSGIAYNLSIPVDCVAAIYARENGHGMAFEVGTKPTEIAAATPVRVESSSAPALVSTASAATPRAVASEGSASARPHLVRIK